MLVSKKKQLFKIVRGEFLLCHGDLVSNMRMAEVLDVHREKMSQGQEWNHDQGDDARPSTASPPAASTPARCTLSRQLHPATCVLPARVRARGGAKVSSICNTF